MNKEAIFLEYMKLFSQLPRLSEIKSDIFFKGNLATFIEWFAGTEEWQEIDSKIKAFAAAKDTCSLCYYIGCKLYNKVIALPELIEEQKVLIGYAFDLFEESYESGELYSITFVSKKYYPAWFIPLDFAFFNK